MTALICGISLLVGLPFAWLVFAILRSKTQEYVPGDGFIVSELIRRKE